MYWQSRELRVDLRSCQAKRATDLPATGFTGVQVTDSEARGTCGREGATGMFVTTSNQAPAARAALDRINKGFGNAVRRTVGRDCTGHGTLGNRATHRYRRATIPTDSRPSQCRLSGKSPRR
jgi:hypothetical protein